MSTRRDNEINELHPNNPASPRYWKNIIPKDLDISQRIGINSLPPIGETESPVDIVFGFGNIYDGNFVIDDQNYHGYIELNISLYDAIKEIQFKLSGVELPVISDVYDANFDGIIGDDPNTKVSIDNNVVTIRLDDGYIGVGCYVYGCVNELLLKIPFISKGADICFLPIFSGGAYISIIDEGDATHTNSEDFGYWNDQIGGPLATQCLLPFIDTTIDTGLSQNWIGGYYYPVLPKINTSGQFDEDLCLQNGTLINNEYCMNENIPFGGFRNWNEEDLYAAITLSTLPESYLNFCLIDIDFSSIEEGVLNDVGPVNNMGILIDDYKVKFDAKTNEPSSKKLIPKSKLDKRAKGKSF